MKHSSHISISSFILVLLFITNTFNAQAQLTINKVFDSAKAANEIAMQNKNYANALKQSDSTALSNLYTADARILLDKTPSIAGRSEIINFYGEMIRNSVSIFIYTTTNVWGSDNNLVIEEGTASFALTDGRVVSKGRYLLVWKREEGALKIFRDTFFSDGKIEN